MARIDNLKVEMYGIKNAELESLQNRRNALIADLAKCEAEITEMQANIAAMSTGFKSSIEAAQAVKMEGEELAK
jgi:hypothetical protein